MKLQFHTTVADKILILVLSVITAFSFFAIPRWVSSSATDVEIRSGERVAGRFSLKEDRVVKVSGPKGDTFVEIHSGRVHIKSSPCPNKICVQMGDFGSDGGCLVCLPNEVVVGSGKEPNNGLDAVSR